MRRGRGFRGAPSGSGSPLSSSHQTQHPEIEYQWRTASTSHCWECKEIELGLSQVWTSLYNHYKILQDYKILQVIYRVSDGLRPTALDLQSFSELQASLKLDKGPSLESFRAQAWPKKIQKVKVKLWNTWPHTRDDAATWSTYKCASRNMFNWKNERIACWTILVSFQSSDSWHAWELSGGALASTTIPCAACVEGSGCSHLAWKEEISTT